MTAILPTPPYNSIPHLNSARRALRRTRAEWLLALNSGMIGVADLVESARSSRASGLRAVPVTQLLRNAPGWSESSTRLAMFTLRRSAGVPRDMPDRSINVGWLVDARAGDSRIDALADALGAAGRTIPEERFPWTRF